MPPTYVASVELTTISCGCCGGTYAIQERYRQRCQEQGNGWTCPYCRTGWGYQNRSETEQLRDRLRAANARADRLCDELGTAKRRRRAQLAATRRLQKKIKRGECPCCGEQFQNIASHMEAAHPDYAPLEAQT